MLNDYSQIIKGITGTPWLITEESLDMILSIVNMRLEGRAFSDDEIRIRLEEARDAKRDNPRITVGGGVGVVSLYGPIFPKANLMTELSGATSLEAFRSDLRELMDNDQVNQVVIDFDTPGGSGEMLEETGMAIKEAGQTKPVYGIADTVAASAGYWLMSQCTKAYSTPSGRVGSIGVRTTHTDVSAANERDGIKVTHIYAGEYKTAGNSDEPLSAAARDYMQETINEMYDGFKATVAEGRGTTVEDVEANYGQGKVLSARRAAEVGMIDGVVTMDNLLGQLVEHNATQGFVGGRSELASKVHAMQAFYNAAGNVAVTTNTANFGYFNLKGELNPAVPDIVLEHAGQEHADPGQEERTNERNDDNSADTGSRINIPPEFTEDSVDESQLRSILGIGEDADIEAAVSDLVAEVAPLREASEAHAARQSFAQLYPAQAAELEESRRERAQTRARDFAASYEQIADADGKPTHKGLSKVALEKVEALHLSMAEGNATINDVGDILDTVLRGGIVDFEERGTSRVPETTYSADPMKAWAEVVAQYKNEDGLEHRAAVALACEKHPDLFEAYERAKPGRR